MTQANILVIDDNAELRSIVRISLEQSGYTVFNTSCCEEGMRLLRAKKVDTILLDISLPDGDGLALIANIRKLTDAPVIVISGKGTMTDRVVGLEMGADDYLAKPFQMEELSARVKASVRRYKCRDAVEQSKSQPAHGKIRFNTHILDNAQFQAFDSAGNSCDLTAAEFRLLRTLVSCPNCVMTRAQILDVFRADEPDINDRTIDVQITRIRKKLGDTPKDSKIIKTVRGMGYMLACETETLPD